jgi:ABC-type transport system involved in multi-copper enzyme maturation permease subunit
VIRAGVIRAEWVKFRSVRGWVVAVVVAAIAIVGFAIDGGAQGSCYGNSCAQPTGPGGEAVSDSFYFVRQALAGNGAITVRVASLTSAVRSPRGGTQRVVVPWAKAGIIVKAALTPGSAYAAIMVTGSRGVRMQDDFTGDIAGPAMQAGWLRLVRSSGSVITGYASADGTRWTRVGAVTLPGLPTTVQGGLFTTSPQWTQTSLGVAAITGDASQSTAVFDHAALTWRGGAWTGTDVGGSSGGPAAGPATGYSRAGREITIVGSGDIAPATSGPSGLGVTPAQTLAGAFIALTILAVVGAMFMTAEYRHRLIRVTLAACPMRGRVLAAKTLVTGLVAFVTALAGTAVAVPAGERVLRSHGVYLPPLTALTETRMIVGTAAALAVCTVLAVAISTLARRGAAAIAAVVALIVVPYVLTVSIPVLPLGAADWLMRVTPAAAFAVEQTTVQYPQVDDVYAPAYGYFPLAPWAGFAVLCAWTAVFLTLAAVALKRRDA